MILKLVSILIPTYNRPEYFRQALESALAQDYSNIEILVGDDSPNDSVENVMKDYLESPQKFPIRYFHHEKPTGGKGYGNMTFLLNHANGEYVNFLFSDDLFEPKKISTMIQFFEEFKDGSKVAFVSSSRKLIDQDGKILSVIRDFSVQKEEVEVISGESFGRECLKGCGNCAGEPTTNLIRRKDLWNPAANRFEVGRFFDFHSISMPDFGTWLGLAAMTDRICVFLREPLSSFRRHEFQNTTDVSIRVGMALDFSTLISTAWINKKFLHNEQILDQSMRSWADLMNEVIVTSQGKIPIKISNYILSLLECVESKNYERFIKLSRP